MKQSDGRHAAAAQAYEPFLSEWASGVVIDDVRRPLAEQFIKHRGYAALVLAPFKESKSPSFRVLFDKVGKIDPVYSDPSVIIRSDAVRFGICALYTEDTNFMTTLRHGATDIAQEDYASTAIFRRIRFCDVPDTKRFSVWAKFHVSNKTAGYYAGGASAPRLAEGPAFRQFPFLTPTGLEARLLVKLRTRPSTLRRSLDLNRSHLPEEPGPIFVNSMGRLMGSML